MLTELKLELKVALEHDMLPYLGEIVKVFSEAVAQLHESPSSPTSPSSSARAVSSYEDEGDDLAVLNKKQTKQAVDPLSLHSKDLLKIIVKNGNNCHFNTVIATREGIEWSQKNKGPDGNTNYSKVGTATTKRVRTVTGNKKLRLFKWHEINDNHGNKDWVCRFAPETYKNLQAYFGFVEPALDESEEESE